jgi:hypothetical protein
MISLLVVQDISQVTEMVSTSGAGGISEKLLFLL